MGRIFNVRLNLDALAAELDLCDSDADKIHWLAGFRLGSRGGNVPQECPQAKARGCSFGLNAYEEAMAFSREQSEKGKQSAAKRAKSPEGNQPRFNHGSNHGSTTVRETSNQSSNPVIQQSSNPGIQVSKPVPPPEDIFDGMDGDKTELAFAKPLELNWRDWRSQHGSVFVARRGEDGDPDAWEATFLLYGEEIFNAMYQALKSPANRIYYNTAITWLEANTKVEPT